MSNTKTKFDTMTPYAKGIFKDCSLRTQADIIRAFEDGAGWVSLIDGEAHTSIAGGKIFGAKNNFTVIDCDGK